jgi:prepilin signal peptidase PulO-like enzyme (type II secretory pathway)
MKNKITNNKEKFLPIAFTNPIKGNSDLFALADTIVDFIIRVGAVIVVFMIIYSGFLFVKAQGDPGELEKAKKNFLWTVVGAVILLGAKALSEVVQGVANDLGVGV